MEAKIKMPAGVINQTGQNGFFPNGNFTYNEDFSSDKLDYRWIGVRTAPEDFINNTNKGLQLIPGENNLKAVAPTSTLFQRQQHNSFSATVTMDYKPKNDKDLAGVVCYQNEKFNYVFGVTKKDKDFYLVLERTEKGNSKVLAYEKINDKHPVTLQISAEGNSYKFNYSQNNEEFRNLGGTVSGDILSTNVAGGFTGNLIGLYATSNNDIKF